MLSLTMLRAGRDRLRPSLRVLYISGYETSVRQHLHPDKAQDHQRAQVFSVVVTGGGRPGWEAVDDEMQRTPKQTGANVNAVTGRRSAVAVSGRAH
jgi:hypothetical protein